MKIRGKFILVFCLSHFVMANFTGYNHQMTGRWGSGLQYEAAPQFAWRNREKSRIESGEVAVSRIRSGGASHYTAIIRIDKSIILRKCKHR